ncbi:MAG: methylmalonyl Co-A mutase-associated GTPase MeaB [Bacteroidota bacterium]
MAKSNPVKKSALQEQPGVDEPSMISAKAAASIKAKRQKKIEIQELLSGIKKGERSSLSRAITLIESTNAKDTQKANELIKVCLPYANKSIRIGITGVPGVGKSTFIEALGKLLISKGKKVAVLAVDPSSTLSKGSILGDKTRMDDLVKTNEAFIRPSASGNSLGGVARKTRESIILCEAAGFDVILIETVGVGQSETAVHSMVDFFLLLKLAGAGDELQGIKRGIIEMADAIVINKADGDNLRAAKLAKVEFNRALHLYPQKASEWSPKVLLSSALNSEGITDVWEMITSYFKVTDENGYFESNRRNQNTYWLMQTIEERLKSDFFNKEGLIQALKNQIQLLESGKTTPFAAAEYLLSLR